MQNIIIYIFGLCDSRKYTVTQEIAKLENFIVVDNHLINSPILSVLQPDGHSLLPHHTWYEIEKVRSAVYNSIKMADRNSNFILTNEFYAEDEEDSKLFHQIQTVAKARSSQFFPVRMLCNKEEVLNRIVWEEKKMRFEAMHLGIVHKKFGYTVLKPQHDNLFEIDVTQITPAKAAQYIIDKIKETLSKEKVEKGNRDKAKLRIGKPLQSNHLIGYKRPHRQINS